MNKDALLANLSNDQILAAHTALESKPVKSTEDRMVAAWLADELEGRVPALSEALDRIFDTEFSGSYNEALRTAYEQVAA